MPNQEAQPLGLSSRILADLEKDLAVLGPQAIGRQLLVGVSDASSASDIKFQ